MNSNPRLAKDKPNTKKSSECGLECGPLSVTAKLGEPEANGLRFYLRLINLGAKGLRVNKFMTVYDASSVLFVPRSLVEGACHQLHSNLLEN